ncbi:hypothetical protein OB955_18020 [Halobacteria archaeon AArc-m2/3/4]|uniref:RING-type E3 ubiquitin transferase n=1 Tax=Natronoglomus mannanivorans TaxID=2979990 RepID=A0ABT2QI58_9EURY|nr:hypothetical protein [Halobacteria archaeon AArc-m2/3/4]
MSASAVGYPNTGGIELAFTWGGAIGSGDATAVPASAVLESERGAGPVPTPGAATGLDPAPLFLFDTVFGYALLFLVGLFLVYTGFRKYKTSQLIANTPTQNIRSLAGGRAEIVGTATPGDDLVEKPISEGKCLYAQYRVEERRTIRLGKGNKKKWRVWVAVDEGEIGHEFYVEDETGTVPIDPTDVDLTVDDANTTRTTVRTDEETPEAVAQFESNRPDGQSESIGQRIVDELHPANISLRSMLRLYAIVSAPLWTLVSNVNPSKRRRRYTEWVVEPGEDVYVFGNAKEQTDKSESAITTDERLVMTRDEMTRRFVISDAGDEAGAAKSLRRQTPLWMGGGVLLSIASLYLMLVLLGL